MLCPNCREGCMEEDIYCHRCGTDLTMTSRSLVPAQTHLPTLLQNSQLPRVAASVGALALGVGLELLRRRLITRLTRLPRSASNYISSPTVDTMREIFTNHGNQQLKLPKGYEIHETAVYFKRVIRREV
jgi:hypothetical protein